MSVSGPCFVIVKDGVPFNKYEVTHTTKLPFAIKTESFFFDNEKDAETYFLFLQQEEGKKELNRAINSDRTFLYERAELIAFKKTINWDELKNKAKTLHFIKQTTITNTRRKK